MIAFGAIFNVSEGAYVVWCLWVGLSADEVIS